MNSNTTFIFDANKAIIQADSNGDFKIKELLGKKYLSPPPMFMSGGILYKIVMLDEQSNITETVYHILRVVDSTIPPNDVNRIFGTIKKGGDGKKYYKDMRNSSSVDEWKELIMPQSGGYRKKHRSTRRSRKSRSTRKH